MALSFPKRLSIPIQWLTCPRQVMCMSIYRYSCEMSTAISRISRSLSTLSVFDFSCRLSGISTFSCVRFS
jgi:hypothetical protein